MTEFNEKYDSYNTAQRDYDLYLGVVDETENLPSGIYVSIIRDEPTHPSDLEDTEENDCVELTDEEEHHSMEEF